MSLGSIAMRLNALAAAGDIPEPRRRELLRLAAELEGYSSDAEPPFPAPPGIRGLIGRDRLPALRDDHALDAAPYLQSAQQKD